MTPTVISKKRVTSKQTVEDVSSCYGGQQWVKEVEELFPSTKLGCINFGYWEQVPESIPLELREKSQLDLYRKVCEFAGIEKAKKSVVLEVGCGRGHGVNLISTDGHVCYGVDLVESQIQKCRDCYPKLKQYFKKALSHRTGFGAEFFDFVISVEAAQHFHSFFSFVQEGYRILKQGGRIALTTFFFPNENCKFKIRDILPEDVSGTHRTISIAKAEEFLKKAGFKNIDIHPIGSKVFEGFCQWATESMSKKNHTPRWIEAYEAKLLDYYLVKGEKNRVI